MSISKKFTGISLPVEIMAKIFAYSINSRGPWFLGAICKTWRAIAWSSPELWTHLSIRMGHLTKEEGKFEQTIQMASRWLARSGTLPLAVSVHRSSWENTLTSLSPLCNLFGKYAGRCHTLILDSLPDSDFELVLNPKDTETNSILEHLELILCQELAEGRRSEFEIHWLDLSRHDRLSTIKLFGVFPSRLQTNWSKLTDVELWVESPLVLEELMDLLEAAPRLVRCKVRNLGGYGGHSPPRFRSTHRLVHQHLNFLWLRMNSHHLSALETLFATITLPSLEDLTIYEFLNYYFDFPANVMTAFVERSGCELRRVQISTLRPLSWENGRWP